MTATNLTALVIAAAGTAHTAAEATAVVEGVSSAWTMAKLYVNEGAGTPRFSAIVSGVNGVHAISTSSVPFSIKTHGGAAGQDEMRFSHSGINGAVFIQTPQYTGGQITRLGLQRCIQHLSAVPASGTWTAGDRVFNSAPAVGQPKSWVCTVSGTPGTWVSEGNL